MKRFLIFLAFALLLVACRPPGENNSSASAAASDPSRLRVELDGEAKMGQVPVSVFLLEDGDGVSGAEIEITGDMTHAGMVPVIVTATEQSAGLYRAEDFQFTMAGDWIITTEVTLADGSKLSDEMNVTVSSQ